MVGVKSDPLRFLLGCSFFLSFSCGASSGGACFPRVPSGCRRVSSELCERFLAAQADCIRGRSISGLSSIYGRWQLACHTCRNKLPAQKPGSTTFWTGRNRFERATLALFSEGRCKPVQIKRGAGSTPAPQDLDRLPPEQKMVLPRTPSPIRNEIRESNTMDKFLWNKIQGIKTTGPHQPASLSIRK